MEVTGPKADFGSYPHLIQNKNRGLSPIQNNQQMNKHSEQWSYQRNQNQMIGLSKLKQKFNNAHQQMNKTFHVDSKLLDQASIFNSQYTTLDDKQIIQTQKIQIRSNSLQNNKRQICKSKQKCIRSIYKDNFCQKHYIDLISTKIKREFKLVYRDPESNYSALDFSGTGKISIAGFLDNIIIKRTKLDEQDIIKWLIRDKIFPDRNSDIDFQQFKLKFFPEYYLIEDINEYEINDHKKEDQILFQDVFDQQIYHHDENNADDKKKIVVQRLQDLEQMLKHRFQHNWISVRRAFLDLDYDHDGYLTSQDIIRYFGQGSKDIDFNDLTKLMKDKDSKKKGQLSYADFSKWMGVVIHQSEGFYFRHDSIKNPPFEGHQTIKQEKQQKTKSSVLSLDVEKTIIDKIHFQWKTLKKAFIDLNKEKTGSIMPMELKNYLKHWGIYLNEEQFNLLFEKFDSDKDGKITYEDFQNTVGNEINPPEHLYFRQDMRRIPRPVACKNQDCLQPPTAVSEYCQMHIKMMQNKSIKIIQNIRNQLGVKWPQFINNLQRQADKDDENLIYLEKFVDILQKIYQINLSEEDQHLILNGFIAKSIEKYPKINISHILQLQNTSKIKKLYKQIDLNEEEQEDAQFVDMSGYFGKFYRQNVKVNKITLDEFVEVILSNNKLTSVMRCIKSIDKDNNGYVTNQELDDILKFIYPEQFGDKDLKKLFRIFASIQNTILIDYKKLRSFLLEKITERKKLNADDHIQHHEKSLEKDQSRDKKELNYINYVLDKQQRYLIAQVPIYKKSLRKTFMSNDQEPQNNQYPDNDEISIKYVHSMFEQRKTEEQVQATIQAQQKLKPALIGNRDRIREMIKQELQNQSLLTKIVDADGNDSQKKRTQTPSRNAYSSQYLRRRLNKTQIFDQNSKTLDQNNMMNEQSNIYFPSQNNTTKNNQIVNSEKKGQTKNQSNKQNENSSGNHQNMNEKSAVFYRSALMRPQTQQSENQNTKLMQRSHSSNKAYSRDLLQTIQQKIKEQNLQSQPNIDNTVLNQNRSFIESRILIDRNKIQNYQSIDQLSKSPISEASTNRKTSTISELRKQLLERRIQNQSNQAISKQNSNKDQFNLPGTINLKVHNETTRNIDDYKNLIYKNSYSNMHKKGNQSMTHYQNESVIQYSTISSFKGHLNDNKKNDSIKSKLAYEWKNIYRNLSQDDKNHQGEGKVSIQSFENALVKNKINLSKEDIQKLIKQYGSDSSNLRNQTTSINYTNMSKQLGLHSNTLEQIRPTSTYSSMK